MDLSNNWNTVSFNLATEKAKDALKLKWLHLQACVYYQKVDRFLGLPTIFLTSTVGTVLVGTSFTSDSTVTTISTYICAFLSFVSVGLMGILRYLDPGTLSQQHLKKSLDFDDIYNDIQVELALDEAQRQNGVEFMQAVQRRISTTQNMMPILPEKFWSQRSSEIAYGQYEKELEEIERIFPPPSNYKSFPPEEHVVQFEESEDPEIINPMQLHNDLQCALRRVKQESKEKRRNYHYDRFNINTSK